MALWSLHIEAGGKSYSTQVEANAPKAAIRSFLNGGSLGSFLQSSGFESWPSSFTTKDIVLFTKMTGLRNMYLCQIGKEGKYVSTMLVRTVSRQQT